MSQRLASFSRSTIFASGLVLFCLAQARAADAPAPPIPARDPTQTNFVDLTGGKPGAAPSAPVDSTEVRVIDLTKGTSLTEAEPPAQAAAPSRVPKTKIINLAVPGAEAAAMRMTDADYYDLPSDTVVISADRENDPYEEDNRGRFQSHVWLHHNIIDPVEYVYLEIVPPPVRRGLHNVLTNLQSPSILANDVLQVDVVRAGGTFSRFVLNSTIGIGGLFDVGNWAGIPYRDDDFGMTLANYGVGDYPYLLVPLIGPSNPRDLSGKVVDVFINPLHYVTLPGGIFTTVGEEGLKQVDKRSESVGVLDSLVENSPDPYAAERRDAREKRQTEIETGGLVSEDEP